MVKRVAKARAETADSVLEGEKVRVEAKRNGKIE